MVSAGSTDADFEQIDFGGLIVIEFLQTLVYGLKFDAVLGYAMHCETVLLAGSVNDAARTVVKKQLVYRS
jgi:hypothetical protein